MKSIRGVFFFMNDSYGEINALLKTQKKYKKQCFERESNSNTAEGGRDRRYFMP